MPRPLSIRLALSLLPLFLVFVLGRCGQDKKHDDEDPKKPAASVPADWDGVSDYAASTLEVIEE